MSAPTAMATEDSMSDDVFETETETTLRASSADPRDPRSGRPTPSPTGYRGYTPDPQLLTPVRQPEPDIAHKTILLGDSGVGKTSLLVQFDTGKFQAGSFSATVGIGFTTADRAMGIRGGDFGPITIKDGPFNDVMLLGDSGVGKTCLLVRFRDNMFLSGNFISTVGIDFRQQGSIPANPLIGCGINPFSSSQHHKALSTCGHENKVVQVEETKVKLQIWDTAGQERFRSVTHAYYRDAHALLLLYDVTNKNSFDNIRAWLGEIKEYAQDDVVIMLLGNKCDCQSSERMVRREDGERIARENTVAFMETSAKTGQNVDLAFMAIAKELKARKNGTHNHSSFNVQEYVREQTQKASCPPCSS